MITLFRRIRERLIASGSVSKYILYAIGEILLVVIGILIAVQINSWNEQRANSDKELAYLRGIHSDLNRQIESLNRTIRINETSITIVHGLLEDYLQDDEFEENDSTFYKINMINRSAAPSAIKTSFSEIMYGAEITLILNEILRNEIVLFYQNLDNMVGSSNTNAQNIFQSQLLPIFYNRTLIDLDQISTMSYELNLNLPPFSNSYSDRTKNLAFNNLNDPDMQLEFINALNLKAIIEGLQRERSNQIIASAERLMGMIENEVRDRHSIELASESSNK